MFRKFIGFSADGWLLPALVMLLFGAVHVPAATVGAGGYSNGFGTQPLATDWATLSVAGRPTDTYDADSEANAITSVNGDTVADGGNPPSANASAVWSSSGRYLQTRPTGNRATVLVGKFINNTGTNVTEITLSYLFTIAASDAVEESGKGTRVYFSLTGGANSWNNVGSLNTTSSTAGTSTRSASVSLNWTNGGSLFLLWFDDNSEDGTDSANQFDNFSLSVTGGTPTNFFCVVSAPSAGATFVSGTSITAAAVTANATAPYTVEYFTNSAGNNIFTSAGTSATPPYNVSLGNLPAGTYGIYAVSTDNAAVPLSTHSLTNSFSVADHMLLKLIAPSDGSTFAHTNAVLVTARVTGGTAPFSVQFYLDGLPSGAALTSPPHERNFGELSVGDHTIRATVTDAKGWATNSFVHTVHIIPLLKLTFVATNATLLEFVARPNITYSIQVRTNLMTGSWRNLTNVNAQSVTRTVQVNTDVSPALPEHYYRVVTPQVP